jgi:hypothetical protein
MYVTMLTTGHVCNPKTSKRKKGDKIIGSNEK